MNRIYTRQRITFGVVAAITLISFFAWYSFLNMNKARKETQQVNQTLKSLKVLEHLLDDVQDIETSGRGFVISGNREFLEPYHAAIARLQTDTTDILNLQIRYPGRKDTLHTLVRLTREKLAIAEQGMQLMQRNKADSALLLVRNGKGKEVMDSIRVMVLGLETADRIVLNRSNENREIAATTTARLFVLLSVVFIIVAALLFYFVRRDLRQKEIFESRLAYLADLTEKSSDGIISVNEDLRVVSWNKGAENIYGYTAGEAIGQEIAKLIRSSVLVEGDELLRKEIRQKGFADFESSDFTKEGKSLYCHVTSSPLLDSNGKLTGFVSVVRDITQRKLAEKLIYEFNHELAEKVREKTEDIRKSEEKLRQVLESAASEFYVIDREYRIILMSKLAQINLEKAWGAEIKSGDLITSFIPVANRDRIVTCINKAFEGETTDYEVYIDMGGHSRWVNVVYTPVHNNAEEITGAFIGTKDITARKLAEAGLQESESRYRTLVEQATEVIVLAAADGQVLQVNEAGVKLLGYSREEATSLKITDVVHMEPDDPPFRFNELRNGASVISNRRVRRKDGTVITLELSTKMLDNGQIIGIGRDISERLRVERALVESENRFRAIFNTQMQLITLLDRDGRILEVNKTALEFTGYRNEDVAGKFFWDIRLWNNDEERGTLIERIREAIRRASAGELIRYEGQIYLPEGNVEVVDMSIKPIPGADGLPQLLIMEGHVVTEMRKAEMDVKQSEAKYRAFFEHSMDGIMLSSPDGSILSANPAACAMFGMTENEITQLGRDGIIDMNDHRIEQILKERQEKGYYSGEINFRKKDGTLFPGEFTSAIFTDAYGNQRTSLIIRDVTARKRIEEEVARSVQRFEMIARTTNDAIWEWDTVTGEKWANATHQNLYGLSPADPVPEEHVWRNRIHPEDRSVIVNRQENTLANTVNNVFISEYRFRKDNGEYVYLFDRCYIQRNEKGEPIRMTGSMMDITARKRSEEKLRESEQRLRLSMLAAKQGLYDLNLLTGDAIVNDQYAIMLGYDPQTFKETNKHWLERLHPDDFQATDKALRDYIAGKTPEYFVEFRQRTATGQWKWILSVGKIFEYDTQGQPLRMLGTHTDITNLKHVEEELIRIQKRFQNLVENISGVYWVNDLDVQQTLYISPSYETVWGRPCEEVYKDPAAFIRSVHPDDMSRLSEAYHHIAEKRQLHLDYRIIRPQGEVRWVAVKINVVTDDTGKRMEYGYAEDITEQRRAETDLLESNARFQIVSRATSDLVWDWDLQDNVLWWNDNYYSSLGYKKLSDRVPVAEWYDRIHPDERERVRSNANKTFRGRSTVWRDEYRYQKADGSFLHFLDRGFIMRNPAGEAVRMIGSMTDMTPIYTVQRRIEESEMRLRTILDTDPECIKLIDEEIRLLDVNKGGLQMMDADRLEDIIGHSFLELVDPRQQKQTARLVKDAFKGKSGALEFEMLTLKGDRRWCEMSIVPFRNTEKVVVSALAVTRDISERKKAELNLKLSEEKYRMLVEQAADAIILFDATGQLLDTNPSASSLLGYSQEEMAVMQLGQLLSADEVNGNALLIDELNSGVSIVGIRRMKRKNGTEVVTEIRSQQLPDGRYLSVIRDMTERLRAEEELKSSFKAVRNLTAHLQNIREEERTNIAREIHDELGQQLTVLKMDIAWLNKRLKGNDEKVNQRLADLLIMLDDTVKSVRRISSQLRPSLLDDLGLTAALEWQAGEFEKRAGIKTRFNAPQEEIPVSEAAKTALFRIFQESLTNVARHSHASLLIVDLKEEDGLLKMSIIDNGTGFEPASIAEKKTLGILGMKERCQMVGGSYEINSIPGEGTSVVVRVPVITFANKTES